MPSMSRFLAMQMAIEVQAAMKWNVQTVPDPWHEPERCNISKPGWFCDADFQVPRHQADEIADSLVQKEGRNIPRLVVMFIRDDVEYDLAHIEEHGHHDHTREIDEAAIDLNTEDNWFVKSSCKLQKRFMNEWGTEINADGSFQLIMMTMNSVAGCRAFNEDLNHTVQPLTDVTCIGRVEECKRHELDELLEIFQDRVRHLGVKMLKFARNSERREFKKSLDRVIMGTVAACVMAYHLWHNGYKKRMAARSEYYI